MNAPVLSYNLEAEAATVGAALVNHGAAVQVASWVTPELFYDDRNGLVWSALLSVMALGQKPNMVTVMAELKRRGELERIGGFDYLNTLTDLAPGVVSTAIEDYARQVEETAIDRKLLAASAEIARIAQSGDRTGKKLGDAQQAIGAIQARGGRKGLVHIGASASDYRAKLEAVQSGTRLPTGTRTGFKDVDEILGGGFQNTDLIILAARPGVGKSSFLTSAAYNIANVPGDDGDARSVLLFSLEMSRDQIHNRLLSMETQIDTHRLRTLHLRKDEVEPYLYGLDAIDALPIFVDDTPAVSTAYVRNEVYRHMAERGKPALIAVDYLQLMTAPGFKSDNRVGIVSAVSADLKALAKEMDCPVLALSQLSRAVEGRTSHVPMLSDLRESGSIEQDADVVMFIYREEMHDKDTDKKGVAELHIAKHRQGPIGVVPMRFDASTTRFDDLTYREMDGY